MVRSRLVITCLASVGLLNLAGVRSFSSPPGCTVRETSLGKYREDGVPGSVVANRDGTRVAYLALIGAKEAVVLNGEIEKRYDAVQPGSIVFSPDGRHHAYIVRDGGVFRRVVDGEEGPAYDQIACLIFSPNSEHTAYLAGQREGGWRVVVDGRDGVGYVRIQPEIFFTPDSARVIYAAQRGSYTSRSGSISLGSITQGGIPLGSDLIRLSGTGPADEKSRNPPGARGGWRVVVGSREQKPWNVLGIPVMSADGKHMAHWVERANGKQCVIWDGKIQPDYDLIQDGLSMSRDGKRLAYAAARGGQWFVVVDGREMPAYDGVEPRTPLLSPDGRRVFFVAIRGRRRVAVVDGSEKEYDDIQHGMWSFSPDGAHLAFAAALGGRHFMVRDGREEPPIDSPRERRGDALGSTFIFPPVFSQDGTRLAYGISPDGVQQMVRVDRESFGPHLDASAPTFSPDGRHVVYFADDPPKKGGLFVDGELAGSGEFESAGANVSRPVFDAPARCHAILFRDGELFRVDLQFQEPARN